MQGNSKCGILEYCILNTWFEVFLGVQPVLKTHILFGWFGLSLKLVFLGEAGQKSGFLMSWWYAVNDVQALCWRNPFGLGGSGKCGLTSEVKKSFDRYEELTSESRVSVRKMCLTPAWGIALFTVVFIWRSAVSWGLASTKYLKIMSEAGMK